MAEFSTIMENPSDGKTRLTTELVVLLRLRRRKMLFYTKVVLVPELLE